MHPIIEDESRRCHLAATFLTRLPLPALDRIPEGGLAGAFGYFPVIGALLGLAGGLVAATAAEILPPFLAALLGVLVLTWASGALHEDGLADLADGVGGGRDRESKLAIMRDSRVGSYGVIALIFAFAARFGAASELVAAEAVIAGLIGAAAWSRAVIPLVMAGLEPARTDGLGHGAGLPEPAIIVIALGLGMLALMLGTGPGPAIVAALAGLAGAGAVAWVARHYLGGFTGDVLGASQQAAEIMALLALAGMLR